jgi:hypothetical protein
MIVRLPGYPEKSAIVCCEHGTPAMGDPSWVDMILVAGRSGCLEGHGKSQSHEERLDSINSLLEYDDPNGPIISI